MLRTARIDLCGSSDDESPKRVYLASPSGALSYILGNTAVVVLVYLSLYAALRLGKVASPELLAPKTCDFLQYFSAGHFVLTGHAQQMYQWAPMLREEQLISFPYRLKLQSFQPFLIYPPFTAMIFAPFAAIPFEVARLVWFILSAVGLASALWLLELVGGLSSRASFVLRFATFIFLPVFQSLYEGQVTLFMLLALGAALVLATHDREVPAGICLALFAVKPQYVLPILLVLVVRRRRRMLTSFAVATMSLVTLPAIVLGPATVVGYARVVVDLPNWGRHSGAMLNGSSDSIYGLTHALLPGILAPVVWAGLSALSLVLLARVARRTTTLDVPFATALIVGLLISPHLQLHEWTLLLLPAAVALRHAGKTRRAVSALLGLIYLAVTFTMPLQFVLPVRLSTFAALALGLVLVRSDAQWGHRAAPTQIGGDALPAGA